MFNIYGNGVHMIGYPVNETDVSWAYVWSSSADFFDGLICVFSITQREAEAKEDWRHMDEERQNEFKQGPPSSLPFSGGELVRTAGRIIKVSTRNTYFRSLTPMLMLANV